MRFRLLLLFSSMASALALGAFACGGSAYHRGRSNASLDLVRPSFASVTVRAASDCVAVGHYDLLVGVTEVTQRQWRDVMGTEPSYWSGCDECPVERVSWYDVAAYANALSEREGLASCYRFEGCEQAPARRVRGEGTWFSHPRGLVCERVEQTGVACEGYRLPTRAERLVFADVQVPPEGDLRDYAIFDFYPRRSHPYRVASRLPNALGLYDTLGNVDEWLEDAIDPRMRPGGRYSVTLDRSWFATGGGCYGASASRPPSPTRFEHESGRWGRACLGFRVVRTTLSTLTLASEAPAP